MVGNSGPCDRQQSVVTGESSSGDPSFGPARAEGCLMKGIYGNSGKL